MINGDCGCGRGPACQTKITTATTLATITLAWLAYSKTTEIVVPTIIAASSVYIIYQYISYTPSQNFSNRSDELNITYKPFTLNIEQTKEFNMAQIPTSKIMIGELEQNNLMLADRSGSQIWAKAGLNFMVANKNQDIFYFSLCSTKIINNTVSVIQDFDNKADRIEVFCSKYQIQPKDIKIKHTTYLDQDVTYVEIQGEADYTAICLLGNIDIHHDDIIITTLGEVKTELNIE